MKVKFDFANVRRCSQYIRCISSHVLRQGVIHRNGFAGVNFNIETCYDSENFHIAFILHLEAPDINCSFSEDERGQKRIHRKIFEFTLVSFIYLHLD